MTNRALQALTSLGIAVPVSLVLPAGALSGRVRRAPSLSRLLPASRGGGG